MASGEDPHDTWYERITKGRPRSARPGSPGGQREPEVVEKKGAELHLQFTDCLSKHKHTVFYSAAAVTIPWSYYKKSVGPFVVSMILALVPDLLYANWRCDDHYKTFEAHCNAVQAQLQQHKAQQQASAAAAGAKR